MELKFIWIEEYKNIKKTGFNFNHSIDEEFQFSDNEIIINPKINNIPKSFFKDNITSVTAIVGKNGSGKTNLGEFINFNLAHVTNGGLATYYAGYKGILIIDAFIFFQESIIIKNIEKLEKLGYEILDYENVPLDKQGGRKWFEMSKNKYIYYSPAFEFRYINMSENLTNISTSYLAFNDIYKTSKHYNFNNDNYSFSRPEVTDSLTAHYVNEMVRESDFILNFNIQDYIGESPTNLIISIDILKENRLLQRPSFYNEDNKTEIHLDKLWTELNDLENRIWNHGFTELDSYKLPKTDKTDNYNYYLIPINSQKDIYRRLFLIYLFKILLKTGNSFELGFFDSFISNPEKINNDVLGQTLISINKKLKLFIDECDWKETNKKIRKTESSFDSREKTYFDLIRNAKLNISTAKKKNAFQELLTSCKRITQNRLFFHYQFSNNYSSGQQNLLNFYSRFYWASNELIESEKEDTYNLFRDRIIIFIDEGEVALHPEWQRLFFSKTTAFLSELFHNRKIQLILTTHSPFVLSDIPKDNVLFLERDENGNTEISNIERENTFGANIYSLLSDSFFMDNSIGAFAEEKMKWALEILKTNHNDYSEDKIHELKYIIDSIGEPIIKEQFDILFNKKFRNDEVNTLRNRIIDLERRLKKGEDDSN